MQDMLYSTLKKYDAYVFSLRQNGKLDFYMCNILWKNVKKIEFHWCWNLWVFFSLPQAITILAETGENQTFIYII